MEPRDFVYWLQGFMEIQKPETLDAEQVQEIKNHLGLVFNKVTPTTPKGLKGVKFEPYILEGYNDSPLFASSPIQYCSHNPPASC